MLRRYLTNADGTLRMRRAVPVFAVAAFLAFFGSIAIVATTRVAHGDLARTLWVIGAVFGLKFPLVALLWWLIVRNREWPGRRVEWSPEETTRILSYLERQAEFAAEQPDAAARLAYLSGEAWNVADNLDGEAKVDALTVALRIDERASRLSAGGPAED